MVLQNQDFEEPHDITLRARFQKRKKRREIFNKLTIITGELEYPRLYKLQFQNMDL